MPIRTVTLLVAAAIAATTALGGNASPAATAQTEDEPSDDFAASIVLAPTEPLLIPDDAEFEFSSLIDNPNAERTTGGTITLSLLPDPVESSEQLHAAPHLPTTPFFEQQLPAIGAEQQLTSSLTVPADDFPLTAGDARGIYLVEASLSITDGDRTVETSATTPIVWRGVPGPSIPLATIVPIVLPSENHALPTRPQLAEIAPRLDALLSEAEAQQATLAIDPRIIVSIRAYGENSPASARDLLERLETTQLASFLLQFGDADPAAQAALGLEELLQPEEPGYVTRLGSFPEAEENAQDPEADAQEEPPSPAPAVAAGGVPDLEQLLSWPQQQEPAAWPAEGQVDAATLALLRRDGIERLVLSSDNVSLSDGPLAAIGGGTAIVTSAALGSAARDAITADTDVEREAATALAAAELGLAAQTDQPAVVLGLDRGAIADAEDPAAFLATLASFGWSHALSVDSLPEGSAELRRASSSSEERLNALQAAVDRESEVNAVSAVLRDPEYLESYQRDRLLEFFATRHARPGTDFDSVATAYAARDADLRRGVRVIDTEHIQLVGTSTLLPVQLQNALPFPAAVNVEASPASAALSLSERRFESIAVPGNGNERVMVPVRARVSSGESELNVTVTDTSGEFVSSVSSLPITIRSNYEQIALWTLGGIAALLFVFGIIRSLRHRATRVDSAAE